MEISEFSPKTGRTIKEDNSIINVADIFDAAVEDGFIVKGDEFVTGAVTVIQTDHKYIHEGIAFQAQIKVSGLAAGATSKIRFKTPATKYVHFRPAVLGSTANIARVQILEEPTFTGNGSDVVANNRNRNSDIVAGVVIGAGATTSDNGDLLEEFTVGSGGNNQSKSGGSISGDANEWVLKRDTEYLISISNIGTSTATDAYLSLFWYEEGEGVEA